MWQSNLPMWSPLLSSHLFLSCLFMLLLCESNLPMQSPLLSSHLFLSCHSNFIWSELPLRGRLSYKATFSLSQRRPLNTGLTVVIFRIGYSIDELLMLHKQYIYPHGTNNLVALKYRKYMNKNCARLHRKMKTIKSSNSNLWPKVGS
jgi:hypothetical protein